MHVECTQWGIVIGEKYLTAQEALDLLQWLSQQKDSLWRIHEDAEKVFPHPTAESQHETKQPQEEELTPAELEELISEDEQIATIDL